VEDLSTGSWCKVAGDFCCGNINQSINQLILFFLSWPKQQTATYGPQRGGQLKGKTGVGATE